MMTPPLRVLPPLAVLLLCAGCLSFGAETLLSTAISVCAPRTLNKIDNYYNEVTLIEGHTPLTEITNLLGSPDAADLRGKRPFIRYDFRLRPPDLTLHLRVARRNGNGMKVSLGGMQKLKVLLLYFDRNGILQDIGLT